MAGRERRARDFPEHMRLLQSTLMEREKLRKVHCGRILPRYPYPPAAGSADILAIEARDAGSVEPGELPARKFSELIGRALVEVALIKHYPGTITEMPLMAKGMDYKLENGVGVEIKCTISEARRHELRNGDVIQVPNWHVNPSQVNRERPGGKPSQVYVFVSAVTPPRVEFWVLPGQEVARQLNMRNDVRNRLGRKPAPALTNRTLPPTFDDKEADTREEWRGFLESWHLIPGVQAGGSASSEG